MTSLLRNKSILLVFVTMNVNVRDNVNLNLILVSSANTLSNLSMRSLCGLVMNEFSATLNSSELSRSSEILRFIHNLYVFNGHLLSLRVSRLALNLRIKLSLFPSIYCCDYSSFSG